jgi:SAM-dependent methyltransferase
VGSGLRACYHCRHYLVSDPTERRNLTYQLDEAEYAEWKKLYERWPGYGYEGKFLEQYLTTKLIPHRRGGVLLDVAARSSPYWILCREQFGMETYRQDLCYRTEDLTDHEFNGYASDIPLPDDSVDAITLHCSFEHFEGDGDSEAVAEFQRLLKPGGQACIIPLYFTTPPEPHQEEPVRFYTLETLIERVINITTMEWKIVQTPRKPALIFSNS